MRYCWAMVKTVVANQYSTSPDGKLMPIITVMAGIMICICRFIIAAMSSSLAPGIALGGRAVASIFVCQYCVAPVMTASTILALLRSKNPNATDCRLPGFCMNGYNQRRFSACNPLINTWYMAMRNG